MYKIKSQAKKKSLRKKVLRPLLGVAIIVVILAALELTGLTHIFRKRPVPATIPTLNTPTTSSNNTSSSAPSSSSDKTGGSGSSGTGTSNQDQPLISPYGEFVSNHHPGADNSPVKENSVCITTPGATCYIKFTIGGTSTNLPAKTTDSDGVAAWYWDVKEAGLTKGDWTIVAVATLNGQTKTTQDPLPLTIQ